MNSCPALHPVRDRRDRSLRSRGARGFTILEVAIATFVLTLAIGTSLIVLARGFASLDSARCISYASQIMQSEMEKMRLTSWGDGNTTGTMAGTGTTGITAYPTAETPITIDSSFYTAGDVGSRMTLTRTATDVHDGMIKITFKISWTTHDGHQMTRTYVTYYGRNGLYDFFVA